MEAGITAIGPDLSYSSCEWYSSSMHSFYQLRNTVCVQNGLDPDPDFHWLRETVSEAPQALAIPEVEVLCSILSSSNRGSPKPCSKSEG